MSTAAASTFVDEHAATGSTTGAPQANTLDSESLSLRSQNPTHCICICRRAASAPTMAHVRSTASASGPTAP